MGTENIIGVVATKIQPLRVVLKPHTRPIKIRPGTYCPVKVAWLAACMTISMERGSVFLSVHAMEASPTMVAREKEWYRLVSDCRQVKEQTKKVLGVISDIEVGIG